MWDELFESLDSPDEQKRRAAWLTLREAIRAGSADPDEQHLSRLLEELIAEERSDTWRQGVHALLAHLLQSGGRQGREVPAAGVPRGGLARWFWDLFREPTIVLRIYDSLRRRDEDAVTELARLLPFPEFRQTKFIRVPTEKPLWDQLLRRDETVCIVGRIGIFGEEAVELFDTRSTQFFFPTQLKPQSIKPGRIDPDDFHRIRERRDGKVIERRSAIYATSVDERDRVDYGLIQRYYQPDKRRHVVVLAGNSRLGTLGTILYLAGLWEQRIPLPNGGLSERDTLEILIRVRAPKSPQPFGWSADTPTAQCVLAGREHRWFPDVRSWGPQRLVVKMVDDEPSEVYENGPGRRPVFGRGSDLVYFIYALWERTEQGTPGRRVSVDDWGDYQDVAHRVLHQVPAYRQRLNKLRGAVGVNDSTSEVRLRVPIELV
ncbi:MAG: hypothetical protein DWQ34_06985 [Planctomycetota bacterium]|nr:MAG: hypothetical protein DWQ29_20085 [Planctomycetota bacterium]REJ95094.1 MAG: hypothetical protein DWQ34_06985 [Planctomycetota bacterium]REK21190.1 MAG: hypothetical protein DWQ41_22530 [Planctomycetota bacterium]REK29598.1 MAG: hypothetical protein DWQ45_22565 [Planctomycetota bacterium]